MQALILGSGRMGRAAAWDLARQKAVEVVGLADRDEAALERAAKELAELPESSTSDAKVEQHVVDLTSDRGLTELLEGYDVVMSSADYRFHEAVTRAAIEAKTHMCDLGGNLFVVERQMAMDADARRQGVTVVPDCGLAPGMADLFAAHGVGRLENVESVRVRVGGLPANPRPPLNYKLVFSVRGLINEYIEPSEILRDGQIVRVPSLTEPEPIEFPYPFGTLEAFHTSGGASTLPRTLRSKTKNLDYKTIRYPGHCAAFAGMQAIGLFTEEPVDGVTPRPFVEALIERTLSDDDTDVVLVRVTVDGQRDGKPARLVYEVIDRHEATTGHSAMARTTAYPAAVIAYMLGAGAVEKAGVIPGELAIPLDEFVAAVRVRGIDVKERWEDRD